VPGGSRSDSRDAAAGEAALGARWRSKIPDDRIAGDQGTRTRTGLVSQARQRQPFAASGRQGAGRHRARSANNERRGKSPRLNGGRAAHRRARSIICRGKSLRDARHTVPARGSGRRRKARAPSFVSETVGFQQEASRTISSRASSRRSTRQLEGLAFLIHVVDGGSPRGRRSSRLTAR